ncbi:hypothetical protein DSO57_1014311 [Entomophthora muscae]|uniref:Uncharacterized protein n=1 Tax=Entomophthora muscae TaxID=34485 RepID=A0ACC2TST6_9FUNG|nr:hypothetical protein DSO57_1014311 [Entomophthora muscae]
MKINILFSAIACGIALCQADGRKYYGQVLQQLNLVRGIIEEQMDHAAARGADDVKRAESDLKHTIKCNYDIQVAPFEKDYSPDGVKDMKKYYFESLEQEVKILAQDKLYNLQRNAHPQAGSEANPPNRPTQATPARGYPSSRPTQTAPAKGVAKRRVQKYLVDTIYYTKP